MMGNNLPDERFLTPEEVSKELRVSKRTVLRWLNKGEIPGVKLGNRWRIEKDDFEEFIEERKGNLGK